MNKVLISSAALILCAGAGTAFADDEDNDGYDDLTGEAVMPGDDTSGGDDSGGGDDTSGGGDTKPAAKSGGDDDGYKMGISVPLIGGSDSSGLIAAIVAAAGGTAGLGPMSTANILWAVGENWLEIGVGLRVQTIPEDTAAMTEKRTAIGFELDAGYRMMKPTEGRVNPYIMPFVQFGVNDFDEAGDHIILGAGAALGVDVMVFDQFTLGARVGLGLRSDDTFETMRLSTSTSALNATIWW